MSNQIFDYLYNTFYRFWDLLFNTDSGLFGLSFGIILLGTLFITLLWSFVIQALGFDSSDLSSFGSPSDYFHKNREKKKKLHEYVENKKSAYYKKSNLNSDKNIKAYIKKYPPKVGGLDTAKDTRASHWFG